MCETLGSMPTAGSKKKKKNQMLKEDYLRSR
jgi:hypothetical protein